MDQFPTRTLAALSAKRRGFSAFECIATGEGAETLWHIETREAGPTLEFARLWAADKDFVSHIEVAANLTPLIIVTCFVNEIVALGIEVPNIIKMRPICKELWEQQKPQRVKAPVATNEQEKNAVVTMPIPVNDLVANFFSKK